MLIAAGVFAILLGVIHSILGELLIFKKLRHKTVVPTQGGSLLAARQLRILWASWHLVTLFGWSLGAILWTIAFASSSHVDVIGMITYNIAAIMLCSALLVLFATKGKHPGWVVLTLISVLTLLS
ncbi:hypothetical protein Q4489_14655 [Thalassotalea sp. 1_MG-2023]|uniref:hypothetical protein n=1 Tax=Thalassotalea sp. 1_MG-2023 TaxID=3062680 RepID=UPI0026E19B0E|nr:hypothetical protein [Thalassotalea sp. 1_MG-2023]MDO6428258.1 hypothetical protein [Thalassotalea sp. 1_MG-2023]